MSPDRRRPPTLHRDPVEPPPVVPSGSRRVMFLFGQSLGDISVTVPAEEAERIREAVGHAWNNPDGHMFTIYGGVKGDGGGQTLINLARVIAVTIQ